MTKIKIKIKIMWQFTTR